MRLQKLTFYISIITLLFTSCDSNVEINVPFIEPPVLSNFQVDFDGETWVAETKTATILDGIITITAKANEDKEIVIINILNDQVDTYNIAVGQDVASISYNNTDEEFGLFESDPELLGRIDLNENDTENQLLSGTFFFNGKGTMQIQQFEDDGVTPLLEEVVNPDTGDITFEEVFITETKEFINGIFTHILYSTNTVVDPDPDPPVNNNEFFIKIDGVEFVETSLTAVKTIEDDLELIIITATRGSDEIILKIPADTFTSNRRLKSTIDNVTQDAAISYTESSSQVFFPAEDPDGVIGNFVGISIHNTGTNRIETSSDNSIFKFYSVLNGGIEVRKFTEGSFSVTYTE